MIVKLHTTEQAVIETANLAREVRNLLRSKGWRYHCDVPGSMWVWQKQLPDGRIICATEDQLALSIEQAMST